MSTLTIEDFAELFPEVFLAQFLKEKGVNYTIKDEWIVFMLKAEDSHEIHEYLKQAYVNQAQIPDLNTGKLLAASLA